MEYGKYIEKLGKLGKAVLKFTIEKYPGDETFEASPPSIDLYVVPQGKEDNELPEKLPEDCFKGTISKNTPTEDRSFEEEVESIFGMFDRWWNKKRKRESKAVWIVAEPHEQWKDHYERMSYTKKLQAGRQIPLIVSLKPRD